MTDAIICIPRVARDGTPELYFPEYAVNAGMIAVYVHVGQHSEASIGYYNETRKPKPGECDALLREYRQLAKPDTLVIRQRLNRKLLNWIYA